ncbi:NAD(+)/NADH kinase [Clostridioides mangenotii]|uniref:NAD(+)/NADH kinase n=1 Tax=Metaclostridioides mangenotii TaxID=1540 RepID=UPI001C105525|nr:NAD(+)/NADH kinase [Clostridioides mangenotii]MBU5307578.1 NAD(+)/NADH kinase [Clostridioides mangenotii]MCR1954347.1 NAD(+)/NADH kinase [Clostridioides mangenotii]
MKKIITVKSNELAKSQETKIILEEKLASKGFEVYSEMDPNTELIISIGGDGSFLKTVHDFNFPDVPIIGINTGHLGFFAEISPEKIDDFIETYLKNEFIIQSISLLEADVRTKNSCFTKLAVNEVVVRGDKSRVIHLNLSFDDRMIQNFSGDGMIVSTSTGSTAYNYSARGSIVDTSLEVIQVTPLHPINTNAYRCFTSSIISSSESVIKISPENTFEDSTLIVIDGVEHRFSKVDSIKLNLAKKKVKLLRLPNYEFWKRVSEKFL